MPEVRCDWQLWGQELAWGKETLHSTMQRQHRQPLGTNLNTSLQLGCVAADAALWLVHASSSTVRVRLMLHAQQRSMLWSSELHMVGHVTSKKIAATIALFTAIPVCCYIVSFP